MQTKRPLNRVVLAMMVGLVSNKAVGLHSDETGVIMGHPPIGKIDAEIKTISGDIAKLLHPTNFISFSDTQDDADGDAPVEQTIYFQWVKPATPDATEVSVDPNKWQPYIKANRLGVSFREVGYHLVAKFTPKTGEGSNPDTGPAAYWATIAKVKDEGREVIIKDPIGPVSPNTVIPEMALEDISLKLLSGLSWQALDERHPGMYGPTGVGGSVTSPIHGSKWHVTYRCNANIDPQLCSMPRFYKHQWLYEKAPGQWENIPGATAPEYQIQAAYIGKRISVDVTPDFSLLN
ncbi:hypothetical protein ACB035_10405 [Aeromonas sp. S12(2024)]|uniref:hypothetical protein n=1 Tax=Aeromonas sp. S12(2024) TaxID=3242885 RepID=UPI003528BF97